VYTREEKEKEEGIREKRNTRSDVPENFQEFYERQHSFDEEEEDKDKGSL
jgi:hypothetical protein